MLALVDRLQRARPGLGAGPGGLLQGVDGPVSRNILFPEIWTVTSLQFLALQGTLRHPADRYEVTVRSWRSRFMSAVPLSPK